MKTKGPGVKVSATLIGVLPGSLNRVYAISFSAAGGGGVAHVEVNAVGMIQAGHNLSALGLASAARALKAAGVRS